VFGFDISTTTTFRGEDSSGLGALTTPEANLAFLRSRLIDDAERRLSELQTEGII
jgi:hypothetical protein